MAHFKSNYNCFFTLQMHRSLDVDGTCADPESFVRGGPKIVSEYDKEIPQSQTADNPMAPRGRAAQPSRDTRKTN